MRSRSGSGPPGGGADRGRRPPRGPGREMDEPARPAGGL